MKTEKDCDKRESFFEAFLEVKYKENNILYNITEQFLSDLRHYCLQNYFPKMLCA